MPTTETPHRHDPARARTLRRLLHTARVLPVVKIAKAEDAVPLAEALARGGLEAIEVTLRSSAAFEAMERILHDCPEITLGAGTVLDGDQLRRAEDVGARFAVSPGLSPSLLTAARKSRIPLLPGVATASEAMAARDAGFSILKLFPASVVGGTAWLKAIHGPLPELAFCPTGGIGAESMSDYLSQPNVVCVGGSWMVPRAALEARDWPAITHAARQVSDMIDRINDGISAPGGKHASPVQEIHV